MALNGLNNKSAKEAKKVNQHILTDTKYKKEMSMQTNRTAKASPTIEELQNGQK